MHYCALYGNESCLEQLFDFASTGELNLLSVDVDGATLFHCAAMSGSTEVLEMLCSHTALQDRISHALLEPDRLGRTPLQIAAACGHVDMVKALMHKCPRALNLHDKAALTPMSHAAALGKSKVFSVQIVINHK